MNYALFAGDDYYPSGGMSDLIDRYETIDDARDVALRSTLIGSVECHDYEWYQIVDLSTFEIVEQSK